MVNVSEKSVVKGESGKKNMKEKKKEGRGMCSPLSHSKGESPERKVHSKKVIWK